MSRKKVDVIVIGSGVAGLMTAHLLADELNVMLITKSSMENSNSSLAQGGMAAAIDKQDDWKQHLADTLKAGLYHQHTSHAELVVKRAPAVVESLQKLGVPFDLEHDGTLSLGMEGAHSKRRIVHVNGDQTGQAFTKTLIQALKNRVIIMENTMVSRLLQSKGQVIGVETDKGMYEANVTVLATGGVGQLYSMTSNVKEATGDGYALAYRAGAELSDMEFVQFHPTILLNEDKPFGLISEAVRGEGARLVLENGERIMANHPLKDLAPRDVVSREIHHYLQFGKNVYLDCHSVPHFPERFPGLFSRCQAVNVDKYLPVAPGAHFISGGVVTNSVGQTSVPGLYAVGEVACTGVHGANRLASNSLLEGLVFSEQAATHIRYNCSSTFDHFNWNRNEASQFEPGKLLLPEKDEIRKRMTAYVGIIRTEESLMKMKMWLERYLFSALQMTKGATRDEIECSNMIVTSWLITEAAIKRTESRGGHYREDYPSVDDRWLRTYIRHSKQEGIRIDKAQEQPVVNS